MKKMFFIYIFLCICIDSYSQVSKYYFTGNIKTNFEWNFIDKSNSSRDVPHPLISKNGLDFSYGRRINNKILIELGSGILHFREQKEALLFKSYYTDFNLSLGIGFSDTLFKNFAYLVVPYYSVLRGHGSFDSNNGYETGDIKRGADIFGVRLGFEKSIYKSFGVRGGLNVRYENYPSNLNTSFNTRENVLITPFINLTYKFNKYESY
jgi:hypothetical protein